MKDKVLIFICFTTAVLFFMCKPMYLILLLTVCSFEYLFFISFVTFYLKAGKAEFYRRFSVSPLKNTQVSTYEIWLKVNEIYAYNRLYKMILDKKKISLKSLLIASVAIFFGFPLKIYKITYFFIKHNVSLHESFVRFYLWTYESVENKKIEVYRKKTYLNSSDIKDINKIL